MKISNILLVFIFAVGCALSAAGADEPYFPEGVFDQEDKESNDYTASSYAKLLRAMGEPSLWQLSKEDHAVTAYRLLWSPSFHPQISVRIVHSGKSAVAHVVKLDGPGSGKPGKVVFEKTRKLTDDEWTWLQVYLLRARYWKMKTSVKLDFGILDGDRLVCEGVENGKYHIVDRVVPDPDYEKLCRFMLDLSGLDLKEAWSKYHEESTTDKPTK